MSPSAYEILKVVHILSAAVLFGTGMGIAYFMWAAQRTRDVKVIAAVEAQVVRADFVFTASAVVVQPLSGLWLAMEAGYDLRAPWLVWSYGLYVLTGLCWVPVVAIQMRMAKLAAVAAAGDEALPAAHGRLLRWWLALGVPAFAAVISIYALMVIRPN